MLTGVAVRDGDGTAANATGAAVEPLGDAVVVVPPSNVVVVCVRTASAPVVWVTWPNAATSESREMYFTSLKDAK